VSRLPIISGNDLLKFLSKKNYQIMGRKGSHVRLHDAEVPGLSENIGYLDAQKEYPDDIARLFLEKMESES
jgi:hypothetical protein